MGVGVGVKGMQDRTLINIFLQLEHRVHVWTEMGEEAGIVCRARSCNSLEII